MLQTFLATYIYKESLAKVPIWFMLVVMIALSSGYFPQCFNYPDSDTINLYERFQGASEEEIKENKGKSKSFLYEQLSRKSCKIKEISNPSHFVPYKSSLYLETPTPPPELA